MKKATFTGCDDGGIWIGRPCNQPPFLSSARMQESCHIHTSPLFSFFLLKLLKESENTLYSIPVK